MMIHQMDAVTAPLNGKLEEQTHMRQPEGYVVPGKEHLVCRLNKSLYSLKQTPQCGNKALHDYLSKIRLKQSAFDPCVYIRLQTSAAIVAVFDDLISITKTPEVMEAGC